MKIVIDIPEEKYEWIKMNNPNVDINSIVGAVANGTPYEERPKGKWIVENSETGALGIKYSWSRCNQCCWHDSLVIPRNFCPNCGADMRGNV